MPVPDVDAIQVRFDGLCVVVRSRAAEVLVEVERTFRAMIDHGDRRDEEGPVVAELDVARLDGAYEITRKGMEGRERGPLGEIRRAVRYHTTRAFVDARADRFWVHAAAAYRDGRGVLLPGGRGKGKSTLVTTLVSSASLPACPRSWSRPRRGGRRSTSWKAA